VKNFSPACERNRQPILDILLRLLPSTGTALEVASGTGQHIAHFAQHLPSWQWQPSDHAVDGFATINAWCEAGGLRNVAPPVVLDVLAPQWPTAGSPAQPAFSPVFDLVYCANMLHISPWATCEGLMQGAARYLAPHGRLITYGPYLEGDVPTSPGNLAFDQSLRAQNAAWGIRQLEDVVAQAAAAGLVLRERVAMPANNLLLVFSQAAAL
jgi:SAM-dependent methyltransferase